MTAEEILFSESFLWDSNPRLTELTKAILDRKGIWSKIANEQILEDLASLTWNDAISPEQQFLLNALADQWHTDEVLMKSLFSDDIPDANLSQHLIDQFLRDIIRWFNTEEGEFIKKSWEARNSRIKELIRQRDEARAAALAAKARQIYPEDNTVALNLAMAAYQLAITEESSAAIMDITSNPNSAFYQNFAGHTDTVQAVAFSPDGQKFISGAGGRDYSAILWDLQGNILARFIGHTKTVYDLTFTPDGQQVLTASGDKTIRLWDLTGMELRRIGNNNSGIASIAISPNGQTIAAGFWDSHVKIFEFSGEELHHYLAHTGNGGIARVVSIAFSPDGQRLLTGSFDGSAKLWDLQGKEQGYFKSGTGFNVESVAFSPDGTKILTSAGNFTPSLWDLEGNELATFPGHLKTINTICFTPDGQQVLTLSGDSTIRLWNLNGRELLRYGAHVRYISCGDFSPDGKWLVTGGTKEHPIKIWNLTGREFLQLQGHDYPANVITFSLNGQKIMGGFPGTVIKQWDLEGKEVKHLDLEGYSTTIAFSPDGQKILAGMRNAPAKLWDLEGNELAQFEGHDKEVISLAISPNGQQIMTGSIDYTARRWDAAGNELRVIDMKYNGFANSATKMAFSPDGKTLLIAASRRLESQVKLYDLDGNELVTFEGHRDYVTAIAFSPNGEQVLTGDADAIIKLWDLKGKELMEFRGHTDEINNLVFSSDGKYFISTAFEETKLWNLKGHQLGRIDGYTFTSVAFSPDRQLLLTAGNDRTILLWRNILGEWANGRIYKLNEEERTKYKIDWEY